MRNRYMRWIATLLLGLAVCVMLLGCGAKQKQQEIPRNTGLKMDTRKIIGDPNTPPAVREGLKHDAAGGK